MTATLPGSPRPEAVRSTAAATDCTHRVEDITIQSAFHSRAFPNAIVGLPKKRFFSDCRSRGETPT
jgi:hypothetical protein